MLLSLAQVVIIYGLLSDFYQVALGSLQAMDEPGLLQGFSKEVLKMACPVASWDPDI